MPKIWPAGPRSHVSLIASAQLHDLEPWAYLRDLLCLLPSWSTKHLLDLAPVNWAETSARPNVQAALLANVYRRATIV